MALQLKVRTKLLLIVATTTLAFALVVSAGVVVSNQQTVNLTDLERRLVPRVELRPRLEALFQRLRHSLQEAVAAQDLDALGESAAIKDELLASIAAGANSMDPAAVARLRSAIEEYHLTAQDVSRRLIAGDSGEEIPLAIAEMQRKQEEALDALVRATRLERHELADGFATVRRTNDGARRLQLLIGLGALSVVIALSSWSNRSMLRGLVSLSKGLERFGAGELTEAIPITAKDELGEVAAKANLMADSLRRHGEERDRRERIKTGQSGLSDELRGEFGPEATAERALRYLVRELGAIAGVVYLHGDDGILRLSAHQGLAGGAKPASAFRLGEGLVGGAAVADEVVVVRDLPHDYLRVGSGLGAASPRAVVLVPLKRLRRVSGVMELAFFGTSVDRGLELLSSIREALTVSLEVATSRAALGASLEEARQLAERLAAQEEELRQNNQELHVQQEELRAANEELQRQRQTLEERNLELESVRRGLQEKANELEKVSAYKSQFLANMSHELRTPLNSMLLLSELLSRNEDRNLTPRQVEYASTVHSSGKDLLGLINQILDLAKIEAGRQEVLLETVPLDELADHARRVFGPLAAEKGLKLTVEVQPGLPASITTDRQRVDRILVNLLGNAIKFTDRGEVSLRVKRPASDTRFDGQELVASRAIAFEVSDTGIGIPPNARERVFAPFEQLDAKMDRRYGGTGLGLAIARESALLLGGELRLEGAEGRGSTFSLYLPEVARLGRTATMAEAPQTSRLAPNVQDDRASLTKAHAHLLVIEDNPTFAEQVVEIIHLLKMKALVASTGREGIRLAQEQRPRGIILDVKLPDIDGWKVMESLRQHPATRDIPVHFVSGVDASERGFALGAAGYVVKPVTRRDLVNVVRTLAPQAEHRDRLLLVEDDPGEAESISNLLRADNLEVRLETTAAAAIDALKGEQFCCMILDLGLSDMDGRTLLETLRAGGQVELPRVIVHTGRALSKEEARALDSIAAAVVLKDGNSEQRLLDEVRLFVRHVKDGLPEVDELSDAPRSMAVSLAGRRILVVDDDMRTVYALSALLRGKGADVLVADTGREALAVLGANPDVDGVLMDVMMPEMDGYEATRRVRRDARFATLPVIALTARAMNGERERCREAGATEYLTKPVDGQLLLKALEGCLRPKAQSVSPSGTS